MNFMFYLQISVLCDSFDCSLTDQQLPLVARLLDLIVGLYYGSLDLPGCHVKKHIAPQLIESRKKVVFPLYYRL